MKKVIKLFFSLLCMVMIWSISPAYVSAAETREWKGGGIEVDPLYKNDPLVQEYLEIYEQSGGISTYASSDTVKKIFCKDIYEAGDYITELARDRGYALELSWIWTGDTEPTVADIIAEPYSVHQPYDTMSWSYYYDYELMSDNTYLLTYYISFNYFTTDEQHQALLNVIEQAIEDMDLKNKADYEQVKLIHDFICDACDYDYDALEDKESNPYAYTAYSALVNGKAVCMGYARAFTLMCEMVGLPSTYVAGTGNGGGHAWNIVKIGDYYYNIDCTWDGQGSYTRWTYYLKCENEFGDHQRDPEYDTEAFHAEYPMSSHSFSQRVPLTGFSLNSATASVETGAVLQLQVCDVLPSNTTDSTKGTWSSNNTGVAIVNENGIVTGVKAGTAIISCTISGITSKCTVTVTEATEDTGFVVDANGVLTAYTGNRSVVVIPNTVKTIGAEAFINNTYIVSVKMPETVTLIGEKAFAGCINLSRVEFPRGLVELGVSVFYGCRKITALELPMGITAAPHAFTGCGTDMLITFEAGTTTIGPEIMCRADGIKEVVLPDGLASIGYNAFAYTNVQKVNIPASLTTADRAFAGCDQLTDVTFAKDTTSIPDYLFFDCEGLVNVSIPETVTSIGSCAFTYTSIEEIVLPAGLTKLGANAFAYGKLKKVNIPVSITSAINSFSGCDYLTDVSFAEGITSIAPYLFNGCDGLTDISIPNTVTRIGGYAFAYCSNLEKIILPEAIASMSSSAFSGSDSVTLIVVPDSYAHQYAEEYHLAYSGIRVDESIEMYQEDSYQLLPTYVSSTEESITWTSSDSAVVSVDTNGVVTANAIGTATITCELDSGAKDQCVVTVKALDEVTLNVTEINSWKIGLTGRFAPYVNGKWVNPATMTWSSSNPEVATCEDGNIVGVGAGITVISCTKKNGTVATCTIKVLDEVTLNTTKLDGWKIGLKGRFASYVNGKWVDPATMTWSSSNPEVATCEGGNIVGVGPGTTIISCTKENGTVATCTVTVKALDVVTLNVTEINSWKVGLTGRFAPYVNGKWVNPATMTWSSSNPEVATCEGGNIVGVGPGTTVISCTKEYGTVATCTVTVKGLDEVTLNVTELKDWKIGLTGRFASYVNGKWVNPATMTWSSSNPEVATCEGGNIVGVGPGTTIISCTKENGTVATCTVTVKGLDEVTLNVTELKDWKIGLTGRFASYVNGKWVNPATMTWSSSNPEVATCEGGNIVGVGPGTTVISCTKDNGTVATCTVTVKALDVVTLNVTELNSWKVGLTGRFAPYVNGKWVNPATMTWSSSNPEVATCEGGNIVGVGVGTTIISCTKDNGTVATCTVTVK